MKRLVLIPVVLFSGLMLFACKEKNKDSAQECETKCCTVEDYQGSETIATIMSRKSVRSFLDKPVEQEKIDIMLRAGMAAPSGMDKRPWHFVVIKERAVMDQLAELLPYAKMLKEAPIAIVVCGDEDASSYWYLDCSAAAQNILLAAEAMGLGAVWTAAYPYAERMAPIQMFLDLPNNIKPLNVIPVGYPKGEQSPKDKWDESKIIYK